MSTSCRQFVDNSFRDKMSRVVKESDSLNHAVSTVRENTIKNQALGCCTYNTHGNFCSSGTNFLQSSYKSFSLFMTLDIKTVGSLKSMRSALYFYPNFLSYFFTVSNFQRNTIARFIHWP